MTSRPYELLARFAPDGTVAGISTRTITTVDGRDYENNPVPLASATDPAFVAFASQFSASAVAENDTFKTTNATLTTNLAAKTTAYDAEVVKVAALEGEKATLIASIQELEESVSSLEGERVEANATITGLQARVAELTPPPKPTSITKYQATKWLRDAGLYDTVMSMLESNQDAKDRWEWGGDLLRDDPIVEALGEQIGLTAEQLDTAFQVASGIQ